MNCVFVLIHGLWLSPLSWESFSGRFQEHGHEVVNRGWPGIEGRSVQDIRDNPDEIVGLTLGDIVSYYESIIASMVAKPVLIGHSMGGLVVQTLLDRGMGSAGVVLDSATPAQVMSFPFSSIRSMFPVLRNPLNSRRAVYLDWAQFRYSFANDMPEHEARSAYDRYSIPAPGSIVFQSALGHFAPRSETRIPTKNSFRPPLLFIAGESDHVIPMRMSRANFRKFRNGESITEFKSFPGRNHLLIAQNGWEEVAHYIEEWSSPYCPS